MIKENIKNTYDVLDYLLDLYNYYVGLSCKNINDMIKLENDKRYKKESFIKNKKIQGLKEYSKYLDEKMKTIDSMIKKINDGEIKEINIKFI